MVYRRSSKGRNPVIKQEHHNNSEAQYSSMKKNVNKSDEIDSSAVVNVISAPTGGGAENIVQYMCPFIEACPYDGYLVFFSGAARELSENCPISRNTFFLSKSLIRNPVILFRLRSLLRRIKDRHSKIVVHAHLTWPFIFIPIAVLGQNIPIIYTEHSTGNRRRKLPGIRFLDRLWYRNFELIVSISGGVRDALFSHLGHVHPSDRFPVIHNGSRLFSVYHRTRRYQSKIRLLSVGSLTKHKGLDFALRVVKSIASEVEEYRIVGKGPQKQRIERDAIKLGIGELVRFVGWTDDVERYYRSADILLIPSVREGFGLVAIEAMSTGLPVVASNVPGLREIIETGVRGATVVNRNVDDWVEAIRDTIKGLSNGCISADEISAWASRFGIERMAREYISHYDKVLSRERVQGSL